MYKVFLTQIVAFGKQEQDNAFRAQVKPIFDRHGITYKAWWVRGRKANQRLIEWGPFESREVAEAAIAEITADEDYRAWQRDVIEAGVPVPGTTEHYILVD